MKALLCTALLWAHLIHVSQGSLVSTADFNKDFRVTWSPDHVHTSPDGHLRTLKLDKASGSAILSNHKFLFGEYEMKIRLGKGHSAGTVVSYYLTSPDAATRDEIDFDFLGKQNGRDYILQTNVVTNGRGDREEKFHLWFDPRGFSQLHHLMEYPSTPVINNFDDTRKIFLVDGVPIRVYKNHAKQGVDYPRSKPMNLMAIIYDGGRWAGGGGRGQIDWSKAPFVASFKDFRIDACVWRNGSARVCRKASETNWWNKPEYANLSEYGKDAVKYVRKKQMVYDYCRDFKRFHGRVPPECFLPQY